MSTTVQELAPPPQAASSKFYRPELDALRFLAFMMVFVHHVPNMPFGLGDAGAAGMGLFFMLSAYLIGSLLLRERDKTGTVNLRFFYIRRILRIWPLYFLAIGLGILIGYLLPAYRIAGSAFPYLFLLAANVFVAHHGWALGVIGPLWSLSIEEQFYLVVPTCAKRLGRGGLLGISVLALVSAYGVLAWLASWRANPQTQIWVNTFVQAQFFALGTLLALWFEKRRLKLHAAVRVALLVFSLALLLHSERAHSLSSLRAMPFSDLAAGYMSEMVACACIFLAFLDYGPALPKPILYLGKISYGLYVFHDIVLWLLLYPIYRHHRWGVAEHHSRFVGILSLLVTTPIAAASYRFFEEPIVRLKERFAIIKSGPGSSLHNTPAEVGVMRNTGIGAA